MLHRLDTLLYALTAALIGASLACMLGVTLWQVAARGTGAPALLWGEEFARYAMFYMVNLGGALALRHRGHPALTLFADMAPPRLRLVIGAAVEIGIALTLGLLAWHGYDMAVEEGMFTTPSLRWSFFWIYLAIPVGAAASLVQLFARSLAPEPEFGRADPDGAA